MPTAFKQVKNNASSLLTSAMDGTTTPITFSVTTGQGVNFPQPGNGFYATIWDATTYPNPVNDPNMEVVLVTARAGDSLTATRAQLGTSIKTHISGARISLLLADQQLTDIHTAVNFVENNYLQKNVEQTITFGPDSGDFLHITKHPTPLDYAAGTTREVFVTQRKDTLAIADNTSVNGSVMQFEHTGGGSANAATEYSGSIYQGLYLSMDKSNDGSGQAFSTNGQLGGVGGNGYNELGAFVAGITNVGSTLGTLAGAELLLKDSPNAGTNSYSTKMSGFTARLAKWNTTSRTAYNFTASSEGAIRTFGTVTGAIIRTGGTGYTTGTAITFTPTGSGTGAAGTIVVTSGAITGITITNAGSGYNTPPVMSFTGGQGAIVDAIIGNHNQMLDAILAGNSQGVQWWKKGLDFSQFNFTTNEVISMQGGGYLSDRIAGGVAIGGSFAWSKPLNVTAATTLTAMHPTIIYFTGATAAFTVTLPTAVGNDGLTFVLKRYGNTNAVTISAAAGQTIDLASGTAAPTLTRVLGSVRAAITVVSNGTAWMMTTQIGTVT